MKIAYNPSGASPLQEAPENNNDIIFDLAGKAIYVKDVKLLGTDTIYDVFKKPTSSSEAGNIGLVPVPSYAETNTRFLREDGTWNTPNYLPLYGGSMNAGAVINIIYKDANNYGGLVFKGSASDGLPAHLYKNITSSDELTLSGGLLVTNQLRLKGSENWSDFISSTYNSDGSITNNATLNNLSCIKHALNFTWYTDSWQIGSVRAGNATSLGFGITQGNTLLKLLVGKTSVNIYDSLIVSGSLSAENGSFYTNSSGAFWLSDRRLKDNISSAKNLNIDSLIKEFDWKDTGKHSWGFIAQELLEVLPEAVNYNEDTDRYSVNYDVAHSAAIASLNTKIKQLELRIKELEDGKASNE